MDYGGTDKRRSKKDLKRKRLARGYKRGGKFRTHNISEIKNVEHLNPDNDTIQKKKINEQGSRKNKGKKRKNN